MGSPFARKNRHWSLSYGGISVGETPLIGKTYDFQQGFFTIIYLSNAKLNDQDSTNALLFLEIVLEN